MKKYPLIGVCIIAVVLLIISSLSNVVGYQPIDSPSLYDSPLFRVKIQRYIHTPQNKITYHYLGEGKSSENDTTPPVTTCILTPPTPNGQHGWYISKITVTLNATDDDSGVNITRYNLDGGAWQTYVHPINITLDGHHVLKYYSVDNAGNIEPEWDTTFSLDMTAPQICANYTWEQKYWKGYILIYNVEAVDASSGMNRTEFFINGVHQETIIGPGPHYEYRYPLFYTDRCNVIGLIRNREITDDYVKFNSVIVFVYVVSKYTPNFTQRFYAYDNAGLSSYVDILNPTCRASIKPGLYLSQNMTLPNNYTGYVGRFLVKATFFGDIGVN
jgi:hypothetical protein